ncbi:MAG TPA: hypothetical protein VGN57_10550 [Pirellulaceae bacterium]|jgi:hypothetical protein|nr:hypothetical protein [Pirellulaceae bacterium]
MNLKRWALSFALLFSAIGLTVFSGCGGAPADVPQAEPAPEELESYEERMRKSGGRG